MVVKQEGLTYKGTHILTGSEALNKRRAIENVTTYLRSLRFEEIFIPIIQFQETYRSKVGEENNNLMFNFKDRADRDITLAPEYTAVVQKLSKTIYKRQKDVKLFYIAECFRGENPQYGRYRQFTQIGVEILNPTKDYTEDLLQTAQSILPCFYLPMAINIWSVIKAAIKVNRDATRGLDYYVDSITKLPIGKGFEININLLGSASQVCGGGSYDGGQGFAIGVERMLLVKSLAHAWSTTGEPKIREGCEDNSPISS